MAADEGLHKLAEYLQQTRKQAEMAIDVLNDKVKELQAHNEQLQQQLAASQSRCDGVVAEFDKYKQENTLKARFKERDDWKALVDRITKDRDRLQEEVQRLESAMQVVDNGSDERKTEESEDANRRKIVGSTAPYSNSSDAALRQKLQQAKDDVDQARQLILTERAEMEEELQRLRSEVSALRQQQQYHATGSDTWVSTIGKSIGFWFTRPSPPLVQAPVEHV